MSAGDIPGCHLAGSSLRVMFKMRAGDVTPGQSGPGFNPQYHKASSEMIKSTHTLVMVSIGDTGTRRFPENHSPPPVVTYDLKDETSSF